MIVEVLGVKHISVTLWSRSEMKGGGGMMMIIWVRGFILN